MKLLLLLFAVEVAVSLAAPLCTQGGDGATCSEDWSTEKVRDVLGKHSLAQWASIEKTINNNLHIVAAEDIYLIAADGKRYVDFNSQAICTNLGYSTQSIADEVYKQMKEVPFLESRFFMATIRAKVIDFMREVMPGLERFHFGESGATAVEAAIRMARVYTGKKKILASYRSFHGGTAGALTLTGGVDERHFHVDSSPLEGTVHFADRFPFLMSWGNTPQEANANFLAYLEEVITLEGPQTIAAIIIESIVGTHGILPSPEGYLSGVQALCRKYDIVFILDEVMAGFGRTGKWLGYQHYDGVEPDIVTMAKGLSAAVLPIGAVGVNAKIGKYFETHNLPIGSTYNAHPSGLAAIWGALKMYKEQNINEKVTTMDPVMKALGSKLKAAHPKSVREARSIGLWGMLEITIPPKFQDDPNALAGTISKGLLSKGVFTLVKYHKHMRCVIVYTNPPLVITEEQLTGVFDGIGEMLSETVDPLL